MRSIRHSIKSVERRELVQAMISGIIWIDKREDLVFKMIGEIYGSEVNHSPITAWIFRLKSLCWKLVSILFDCTLQLWLTAHYKVLSGSERVLSGPSRIWPKYREHAKLLDEILDLTAHLWKRDSPKSWQRTHSLGKKTVFGIEMTEVRDAGLSLKRRGSAGSWSAFPARPRFVYNCAVRS